METKIYKCAKCGMEIEVIIPCNCENCRCLECCGEPLKEMTPQTADFKTEKHVPVVEEIKDGMRVVVGSTPHPMTAEHHIEWIEVINGDWHNRKYLAPTGPATAEFYVKPQSGMIVREFCNIHGLWEYRIK